MRILWVLRGGSWLNDPYNLRASDRFRYVPDYRSNLFGFRVVLVKTDRVS